MDVSLVKSVVEDAKKEYAEKAKVRAPNVTIDSVYLPPPPNDADPHHASWYPLNSFSQIYLQFLSQILSSSICFILGTYLYMNI